MLAWHFCQNDRKLGYGDSRVIRTGRTYRVDCEPILCQQGLHGSVKLWDALSYARGDILCRVRLGGTIVHGSDKVVATERTVLSMRNVEPLLHEFACRCAERALKCNKVTDKRYWSAIEIKRAWLKGKATDKQMAAAWAAAWDVARPAAWAAARPAAWAAAGAAAWDAARPAAGAAARDAAWAAARAAARDAAGDAARDAEQRWQSRQLTKLLKR